MLQESLVTYVIHFAPNIIGIVYWPSCSKNLAAAQPPQRHNHYPITSDRGRIINDKLRCQRRRLGVINISGH